MVKKRGSRLRYASVCGLKKKRKEVQSAFWLFVRFGLFWGVRGLAGGIMASNEDTRVFK